MANNKYFAPRWGLISILINIQVPVIMYGGQVFDRMVLKTILEKALGYFLSLNAN
jgi:hypothetical protein